MSTAITTLRSTPTDSASYPTQFPSQHLESSILEARNSIKKMVIDLSTVKEKEILSNVIHLVWLPRAERTIFRGRKEQDGVKEKEILNNIIYANTYR